MSFDTPNPPYNASDPYATYVNASCFDFLLIELVPLAARTSAELALRDEEWVLKNDADTGGTASSAAAAAAVVRQNGHDSEAARKASGAAAIPVDDASREALQYRLDMLGYRVGLAIAERYCFNFRHLGYFDLSTQVQDMLMYLKCRFSRDRPRFTEALDVIKFLCKDLWTLLFRKQIDNLKTNHRVSKLSMLTLTGTATKSSSCKGSIRFNR